MRVDTLTLTEVVYKLRSDHPLCAFTAEDEEAKVILNKVTYDHERDRGKAIVTAVGPKETYQDLAERVQKVYPEATPLKEGEDFATFKVHLEEDTLRDRRSPELFAIENFGDDAIIEPSVIKEGYLHSRIIVTGDVDVQELLERYKDGVEDELWEDFKLIRMDDFDPQRQIIGSFDNDLTPKQLEVIKVAHALGFYDTPRKSTLDDISSIFGISKAAVHNRLQSAERKVIGDFFS